MKKRSLFKFALGAVAAAAIPMIALAAIGNVKHPLW